jgi:hypothetical protein
MACDASLGRFMEQGAAKFNCRRRSPHVWDSRWASFDGKGRFGFYPSTVCRDEFEGIAVALDMTSVEMPADDQHRPIRKA